MTSPPEPPAKTLAAFGVHNPTFVAASGLGSIWKVQRADQSPAALKCYFDKSMPGEASGFTFLHAIDGRGAAKIYTVKDGVALLEWLDGPSLGDLSRAGQDTEANKRLVATACKLHETPTQTQSDMPRLTDWFSALRDMTPPAVMPVGTKQTIYRAQKLAERLLANQTDMRPLHGDLHHDNIKDSARGDLAFDAKGIVGDRGYELANAFLNPLGAEATVRSEARIRQLMAFWGQAFDIKSETLLDWACAHAALAVAWHIRDGGTADTETLHVLWKVRDGLQ